jgi:hypothetical protein
MPLKIWNIQIKHKKGKFRSNIYFICSTSTLYGTYSKTGNKFLLFIWNIMNFAQGKDSFSLSICIKINKYLCLKKCQFAFLRDETLNKRVENSTDFFIGCWMWDLQIWGNIHENPVCPKLLCDELQSLKLILGINTYLKF